VKSFNSAIVTVFISMFYWVLH